MTVVTPDQINEYFENFKKVISNIPSQLKINYKTNISYNPGRKKNISDLSKCYFIFIILYNGITLFNYFILTYQLSFT